MQKKCTFCALSLFLSRICLSWMVNFIFYIVKVFVVLEDKFGFLFEPILKDIRFYNDMIADQLYEIETYGELRSYGANAIEN